MANLLSWALTTVKLDNQPLEQFTLDAALRGSQEYLLTLIVFLFKITELPIIGEALSSIPSPKIKN